MTCVIAVFAAGVLVQSLVLVDTSLAVCKGISQSYIAAGYGVRRETFTPPAGGEAKPPAARDRLVD